MEQKYPNRLWRIPDGFLEQVMWDNLARGIVLEPLQPDKDVHPPIGLNKDSERNRFRHHDGSGRRGEDYDSGAEDGGGDGEDVQMDW